MRPEDTIPDALADALGKIVADCKREWMQELEVLRAERRALLAELRLAAAGITTSEPAATETAKAATPAGKAKPGART